MKHRKICTLSFYSYMFSSPKSVFKRGKISPRNTPNTLQIHRTIPRYRDNTKIQSPVPFNPKQSEEKLHFLFEEKKISIYIKGTIKR